MRTHAVCLETPDELRFVSTQKQRESSTYVITIREGKHGVLYCMHYLSLTQRKSKKGEGLAALPYPRILIVAIVSGSICAVP